MAKLPAFKRFSVEDFPDQKDWIDKLLGPLNEVNTRLIAALVNGINFSDNIQSQLVTGLRVQTAASVTAGAGGLPSYAKLFKPISVRVTMKVKPIGLQIWKVLEDATNPAILPYGISADWTYNNGLVTIAHISGLEPSKNYTVTLALLGG